MIGRDACVKKSFAKLDQTSLELGVPVHTNDYIEVFEFAKETKNESLQKLALKGVGRSFNDLVEHFKLLNSEKYSLDDDVFRRVYLDSNAVEVGQYILNMKNVLKRSSHNLERVFSGIIHSTARADRLGWQQVDRERAFEFEERRLGYRLLKRKTTALLDSLLREKSENVKLR